MDLALLINAVWPVDPPRSIEPLGGGINNRTFRLESASGAYILRFYPSNAKPAKIEFETAVLAHLANSDLPFQVPAPILTRTGAITPWIRHNDQECWAMLVPVIPGGVRVPESQAQAQRVGAALGSLHQALIRMALPPAAVGSYGSLETVDPLLPDPLAAATLPIIDPPHQKRIAQLLEAVLTERQRWYSTLPQQVIHGDYVPFNLLMAGDKVTAILDFELACYDPRAMDFAIGFWPWLTWGGGCDWAMAEAFARGYTTYQTLSPAEAEALPFLLRLRRAGSILWWAGKYLQGAADEGQVKWAISAALKLEDWLGMHQGDLLAHAAAWRSAPST